MRWAICTIDTRIHRMMEAAEAYAMNLSFLGKGNSGTAAPLKDQILAGAIALGLARRLEPVRSCRWHSATFCSDV